jgi:hypothetical protein
MSEQLLGAYRRILDKIDTKEYNIRTRARMNPNSRYENINLLTNEEYVNAAPPAPYTIEEAADALKWLIGSQKIIVKLVTQVKIATDVYNKLLVGPNSSLGFTLQEMNKIVALLVRQYEYLVPRLAAFKKYLILMDATSDFDVTEPVVNEIRTLIQEQRDYGRIIPEETNRVKKMRLYEAQQLLYILQQKINVTKRKMKEFKESGELDLLPMNYKELFIIKLNK